MFAASTSFAKSSPCPGRRRASSSNWATHRRACTCLGEAATAGSSGARSSPPSRARDGTSAGSDAQAPPKPCLARADQPLDRTHQLIDLLLPARANAVANVVFHHAECDTVECGPCRGDLRQDVNAVALVL